MTNFREDGLTNYGGTAMHVHDILAAARPRSLGGRRPGDLSRQGRTCERRRLAGRPGKLAGLERFLKHALGHKDVWFCRRVEIAKHWRERHPYAA